MRVSMGGEVLHVQSELGWLTRLIAEALDGGQSGAEVGDPPTIDVVVERSRRPFPTAGWPHLTRDAQVWRGAVVVRDVCTSGFDVRVEPCGERLELVYRWRPPPRTRAAGLALPSRFHLLARAALLQYPAMWWASRRGAAPLHAPALAHRGTGILLAGPSGVGKTTIVAGGAHLGAVATADNLVVSDGVTAWGVVEPVRAEGGAGRRMAHGRRERALANRVPSVRPDRVVVLRRATPGEPASVVPCSAEEACRELVTGTFVAGELRRF